MRNWVLLPLALLFSLQLRAATIGNIESVMLSQEEFSRLTPFEQKSYVRQMRQIFVDLAENHRSVVEEMMQRSPAFAQAWGMVFAEANAEQGSVKAMAKSTDEEKHGMFMTAIENAGLYNEAVANVTNPKDLSPADRAQYLNNYRQATEWTAFAYENYNSVKSEKLKAQMANDSKFVAALTKVQTNESRVKSVATEKDYVAAKQRFLDAQFGKQVGTDFPEKLIEFKVTGKTNTASAVPEVKAAGTDKQADKQAPTGIPAPPPPNAPKESIKELPLPDAKPPTVHAGAPAPVVKAESAKAADKAPEAATAQSSAPVASANPNKKVSADEQRKLLPQPLDSYSAPAKKKLYKSSTGADVKSYMKPDQSKLQPQPEKNSGKILRETDPSKKENDEAKLESPKGPFRCMYSGFIVEGDATTPCMGPSKLPWKLDYIDQDVFTCVKGTTLCNPFIFGFKTSCDFSKVKNPDEDKECWKSAEPYCVKRGQYATRNCNEISNSDKAIASAVELINKNASQYNAYMLQTFKSLCNDNNVIPEIKERAKSQADILATCKEARTRITKVSAKYKTMYPKDKKAVPATVPAADPATSKAQ